MTEPLIPPSPEFNRLVRLFKTINEVSGVIQKDISLALLRDPAMQKKLSEQMKMSESDIETQVDKTVTDFIKQMLIATMNGYNLFGRVFAMHSNITGDPLMHDVFDEVNRQVFEEMNDR